MKNSLNKSNAKKTNTSRKRKKYKTLQKSLKNKNRKLKPRSINTFKQLFIYNDKKIFLLLKQRILRKVRLLLMPVKTIRYQILL